METPEGPPPESRGHVPADPTGKLAHGGLKAQVTVFQRQESKDKVRPGQKVDTRPRSL